MNETCSRGIQLEALRSAAVRVHLCAHLYIRSTFLVTSAGGGILLRTTVCLTDGVRYSRGIVGSFSEKLIGRALSWLSNRSKFRSNQFRSRGLATQQKLILIFIFVYFSLQVHET